MNIPFLSDPRLPRPVAGLGWAFVLVLGGEFVAIVGGVSPLPEGYLIGVTTSLPFVVGLVYGSHWIATSELSTDRYGRINRWCLGGALVFLSINIVIMIAIPPAIPLTIVAWARWAASIGAGTGLLIGVFEARTIRRELAGERIRIRQEELQRERDRLEEFAGIISHDLRNPLNIANGHLELAQQHGENGHLDRIEEALGRMEVIIEDTLKLAREGKSVGRMTSVDLADLARTCWKAVNTAEAELEVERTATIQADRDRLRHIFENLFRNAVEHGGTDVTIRVGPLDGADGFYIQDDGPGIPDERRERVMEAGYTSSETGSGLGLTIVEQIVEAHGWGLRITDGTSGGARFEITDVTVTEQ